MSFIVKTTFVHVYCTQCSCHDYGTCTYVIKVTHQNTYKDPEIFENTLIHN